MADKTRVTTAVVALAEAFGRKCSQGTFEAYWQGLGDLTDEQVAAAFQAAIRSPREFMPTPGQLRELALTGRVAGDTSTIEDASVLVSGCR